jgi:crooked neck
VLTWRIVLVVQAYIEFEISEREYDRTRQLYERLLDRTKHLKVWVSFAKFEAAMPSEEEARAEEEGREPDPERLLEETKQQVLRSRGEVPVARSFWLVQLCFW